MLVIVLDKLLIFSLSFTSSQYCFLLIIAYANDPHDIPSDGFDSEAC
jgi:hypothetical protein